MNNVPLPLLRRAVRLFNSEYVPREINRANRVAWLRAVHRLGDKWLLADPINKDGLLSTAGGK